MTAGFYKKENDQLFYGPNIVEGDGYLLLAQNKNQYEYPVHEWYWFDSEELANDFFQIKTTITLEADLDTLL